MYLLCLLVNIRLEPNPLSTYYSIGCRSIHYRKYSSSYAKFNAQAFTLYICIDVYPFVYCLSLTCHLGLTFFLEEESLLPSSIEQWCIQQQAKPVNKWFIKQKSVSIHWEWYRIGDFHYACFLQAATIGLFTLEIVNLERSKPRFTLKFQIVHS